MSSANRAERRRQERAAAKGRTLYHGTAGVLVDQIRREGLRVDDEGRVFVTDSRPIAHTYAVWEAARQASLGAVPDPAGAAGRRALALGGHVGAVLTINMTTPVTVEEGSVAPPLPWETTMRPGTSYFTTQPIARGDIGHAAMWSIRELDDPAMVDLVCRDSVLITGALHRRDAVGHTAPLVRRSSLHRAIPDIWALHEAAINSPNARSRWHGETHWLGVLAAAVRLVERGAQADPALLIAFSLLHDSQRLSEGRDPKHGERAAAFARELQSSGVLRLDVDQRALLQRALIEHDHGLTSSDETIGACWDADRLTLPRVGITVDAALLSTDEARELLADGERVPDPADCDWDWALSRMYVLAAGATRARAVA